MTIEELRMVNRICAYMQRAANMVANECPYDIDGAAAVTDLDTDEQVEVY